MGAAITLLFANLVKWQKKRSNLKKQTQLLSEFINDIIIKYLKISISEYEKLLLDIQTDKIFKPKVVPTSPMLSKGIFDFFEKSDLTEIFSYCKKNSLVEVYHNFYEIDYLQTNSPLNILSRFHEKIRTHFEKFKGENETLKTHIEKYDDFFRHQQDFFIQETIMHKNHCEHLVESFEQIATELKSIDELNEDNY